MGPFRKQLAPQGGLQKSRQTEGAGRRAVPLHSVGGRGQLSVLPGDLAVADPLPVLQLCRTDQTRAWQPRL